MENLSLTIPTLFQLNIRGTTACPSSGVAVELSGELMLCVLPDSNSAPNSCIRVVLLNPALS
jgi:hypothetical protein